MSSFRSNGTLTPPNPALAGRARGFTSTSFGSLTFLVAALVPLVLSAIPLGAQAAGEKLPLQIADYATWRTMSGATISADARLPLGSVTRIELGCRMKLNALEIT